MKVAIISGVRWEHTFQRQQKTAIALNDLGVKVDFITGIKLRIPNINEFYFRIKSILGNKNKNKINYNDNNINRIKFKLLPPTNIFFDFLNKLLIKYKYNSLSQYDVVLTYLPHPSLKYLNKEVFIIYDCVRDFSEWGGYPKRVLDYELSLLKNSNIVLFDSYWLGKKINSIRKNRLSYQILPTYPRIIDELVFNAKTTQKISSLCYYGSINNKIDSKLLNELSNKFNITLIGPISDNIVLSDKINCVGAISEQRKLFEEILKYDALIIPYLGNMNGVIPAKTTELLNLNRPTFISKFYDSDILSENWYVYENYLDLIEKIQSYNIKDFEVVFNKNKKIFSKCKNENLNVIYSKIIADIERNLNAR